MGGRGSSSSFAVPNSSGSVRSDDGTVIDLNEFPLQYGPPEALSKVERAAVDAFENKRFKNKVEYGTLVAPDGKVLFEKKGGSGSVRIPSNLYPLASVLSHNHPRSGTEKGELGGTFSLADISVFGKSGLQVMRATALEGTYSISRTLGFDSKGLTDYYRQVEIDARKVFSENTRPLLDAYKSANAQYKQGQLEYSKVLDAYDKYLNTVHHEFNRALVAQHNALINGQKQYGYSYTLERR